MKEKSKNCCEEHLDRAFDDFLVEFETFPVMKETSEEVCSYCLKTARYVLELSDDKS